MVIHKIYDAASLTVSLEVIMITSKVKSHNGRDLASIDIPGAY